MAQQHPEYEVDGGFHYCCTVRYQLKQDGGKRYRVQVERIGNTQKIGHAIGNEHIRKNHHYQKKYIAQRYFEVDSQPPENQTSAHHPFIKMKISSPQTENGKNRTYRKAEPSERMAAIWVNLRHKSLEKAQFSPGYCRENRSNPCW